MIAPRANKAPSRLWAYPFSLLTVGVVVRVIVSLRTEDILPLLGLEHHTPSCFYVYVCMHT